VVVVIDVLRAFSTAAYAFAAGAAEIILVSTVEEALSLRARRPGSFAVGEVGGLPVEGFDYSNSPSQIADLDLNGRLLIQRTSSGTQGVVRSTQAGVLLAASFVCARATARAIAGLKPQAVSFVITGLGNNGYGDEDAACADYIEALLTGKPADIQGYLRRVLESPPGRIFADPAQPEFPAADLDYCTRVDCFDFAMQVQRRDGLHVLSSYENRTADEFR
jgi:2-phosphosulfolactate phosphatase